MSLADPATRRMVRAMADDGLWYKNAVFYELHVRSFQDGNNDGVGDFRGLTSRLDYLRDLGVDCIWLLPFFPSPRKDDGYDIADYRGIHPNTARWTTSRTSSTPPTIAA
jgi:maltose alpha-D-glucosyltransferase/alpha-amylase